MPPSPSSKFIIMALVASGIIAASSIIIVPYFVTAVQRSEEIEKRILTIDSMYDLKLGQYVTKTSYVHVGDMQPNTAAWFLDPYGKAMNGQQPELKPGMVLDQQEWSILSHQEPFEIYQLIRLPEWLGGFKDGDISAYRAYSAVAISDQCLSKYWPTDGRWRIENPCAGDLYRPWDGVATGGPAAVGVTGRGIIMTGHFGALSSMDLSMDKDGYITAKRPNTDYSANGAVGEGRRLTLEMMKQSNSAMVQAASEYLGYAPPFPDSIPPSHYLSELRLAEYPWWIEQDAGSPDKLPLQAVYYSAPSEGDTGYGEVAIAAYALDDFPKLRLDSPVMTVAGDVVSTPSPDPDKEYLKLNQTVVEALIHLDWYDNPSNAVRLIKSGTNIAGEYAVLIAPSQIDQKSGYESTGSGALIWGKSSDGKRELTTIRAGSMEMDKLIALAKSLDIQ
jgi:hypothetical protein